METLSNIVKGLFYVIGACIIVALVVIVMVFGSAIFFVLAVLAGIGVAIAFVAWAIKECVEDRP